MQLIELVQNMAFQLIEERNMEVAQPITSEMFLLSSLYFFCDIGDNVMQSYENVRYFVY